MHDRAHEKSSACTRKLKRFHASQDGMSALEFALISPVLLFLLCASVDIGRALTASNRATYLADGLAELISRVPDKTTLTPAALNGFIDAAPLLNPEILYYAKQSGTIQYQSKVDITITSIQYIQTVPACKSNCDYTAEVVFSHVNGSPSARRRECGQMIAVSDSASYSPKVLAISSYGPVNLIVIDVGVYYKPYSIIYILPIEYLIGQPISDLEMSQELTQVRIVLDLIRIRSLFALKKNTISSTFAQFHLRLLIIP